MRIAIVLVCTGLALSILCSSADAKEVSPAAAGVMSAIMPGAGQIYSGYTGTGLGFMAGMVVALTGAVVSALEYDHHNEDAWGGAFLALHAWNIADAVHRARRHNQAERGETSALVGRSVNDGRAITLVPILGPRETGILASVEFRF